MCLDSRHSSLQWCPFQGTVVHIIKVGPHRILRPLRGNSCCLFLHKGTHSEVWGSPSQPVPCSANRAGAGP